MNLKELLKEFIEQEKTKGFRKDTIKAKKRHVKGFLKSIKYNPLKLTEDSIVIYLISLKTDGLSCEKTDLNLTHIKQFCGFLVENEFILTSPAMNIERINIRSCTDTGIYTTEEVKSLLKSSMIHRKRKSSVVMKRDRSMIELFYSTGMRVSELSLLDVDDVDFSNREINLYNAKGESQRIVPVGEEALVALGEYIKDRGKLLKPEKEYDALFLSRLGNRLSIPAILKMIYRRKEESGIDSKGATHAFRRSCATHMLANGASIFVIGRMLGHRSLETTKKYALAVDEDLKRVYGLSHPKA